MITRGNSICYGNLVVVAGYFIRPAKLLYNEIKKETLYKYINKPLGIIFA